MVYCGAPSKGCQRCRKRKIKCDERKPGCMACERSKVECPGYRNLADVIFHDESRRLSRRAALRGTKTELQSLAHVGTGKLFPGRPGYYDSYYAPSVPDAIRQPITDVGAHFFFANYISSEPPLSEEYVSWLKQMYSDDKIDSALRASIEATGMSSIANISHSPELAARSREHYGKALAATNSALRDPERAGTDAILAAVTFLGIFEFINIETIDMAGSWRTHLEGATALLQLRGGAQFKYERGGQLYVQLRSQIFFAYLIQSIAPSSSLLRASQEYRNSVLAERRSRTLPRPIGEIYLEVIRFRADIQSGILTDMSSIHETAMLLDKEVASWTETLPSMWEYTTVEADEQLADTCFQGKRHLYHTHQTARVWNNWRTMRILLNRVLLDATLHDLAVQGTIDSPLSVIHQLSTEICIASSDLMGSPHTAALIWPLMVVSQEVLNPPEERLWAVKQLRRIASTMGIRQAEALANAVAQELHVN